MASRAAAELHPRSSRWYDVLEGLQGAQHLQANEAGVDAVEQPALGRAPESARRWPTAA